MKLRSETIGAFKSFDWHYKMRITIINTSSKEHRTMTRLINAARHNRLTLMKTGSYYVIHVCVAAMVAYAVTGNLIASLTLSLLEPTVQAVAFFFHEKGWERALNKRRAQQQQADADQDLNMATAGA